MVPSGPAPPLHEQVRACEEARDAALDRAAAAEAIIEALKSTRMGREDMIKTVETMHMLSSVGLESMDREKALRAREETRVLAARAGLKELSVNEESRVVIFADDKGVRFNVYYTTGTVATYLDHPVRGKTQLFRRNVDLELLARLFREPRLHTGTGYHRRNRKKGKSKPDSTRPVLDAFWYPNLTGTIKVQVNTEVSEKDAVATHDHGAACHEMRHFIDLSFLMSLPTGQDLLDSLVPPNPYCTRLTGTDKPDGEVVLGMLPTKLVVEHKDSDLVFSLCNVLVVDDLPVPLHISFKALESSGMPQQTKRAFSQMLGRIQFDRTRIPGKDGTNFIGMLGLSNMEEFQQKCDVLQAARGDDRVHLSQANASDDEANYEPARAVGVCASVWAE